MIEVRVEYTRVGSFKIDENVWAEMKKANPDCSDEILAQQYLSENDDMWDAIENGCDNDYIDHEIKWVDECED